MLTIVIPAMEGWDEVHEEFVLLPSVELHLEHSLLSISKWETKWKKAFLSKQYQKTQTEVLDYVRCMTLDHAVSDDVYARLTATNLQAINDYIEDQKTASTIKSLPGSQKSSEYVTSELIYYWMVSYGIPFECQKWHLSRLLTLIKICDEKNRPAKKMGSKEVMKQNASLNAARRKKLHSKG